MANSVAGPLWIGICIGFFAPKILEKFETWYNSRPQRHDRKSHRNVERIAIEDHSGHHRALCPETICSEATEAHKVKAQRREAEYQASIRAADPESKDPLERWAAFLQDPENKPILKKWYNRLNREEKPRQHKVSQELREYGIWLSILGNPFE
ncbi:MAG: hypothetical protein L6R38_004306 [Xanthoria sp. 2 TBL-2021]|nr:MAG: hypothetical protein L6R38_004306 [Xanthoria sp. 2 TBL-2021]